MHLGHSGTSSSRRVPSRRVVHWMREWRASCRWWNGATCSFAATFYAHTYTPYPANPQYLQCCGDRCTAVWLNVTFTCRSIGRWSRFHRTYQSDVQIGNAGECRQKIVEQVPCTWNLIDISVRNQLGKRKQCKWHNCCTVYDLCRCSENNWLHDQRRRDARWRFFRWPSLHLKPLEREAGLERGYGRRRRRTSPIISVSRRVNNGNDCALGLGTDWSQHNLKIYRRQSA